MSDTLSILPAKQVSYRALWPLPLLFIAEVAAFGLAVFGPAAAAGPWPVTRLSLGVAIAALLTGLIPALARPSTASLLAGGLAIIGASFLAMPFELSDLPGMIAGRPTIDLPPLVNLRLVNAALMGPLALHLTARFPKRSALTDGHLALAYGITAILLGLLVLAPPGPRLAAAFAGFAWMMALLGASLLQLFIAGRHPSATSARETWQARLLLFTLALAYTPIGLRLLGLLLGKSLIDYNLMLVGQLVWPVGITYIVLRHDLFDIDAVLRRGLAYAALSLGLLAIYFGLTLLLTAALAAVLPQFRGFAALVGLFAAAAAFTPLRRRAQWAIDRALYPERLAFQAEVRAARGALSGIVRRGDVVRLLIEGLPGRLGAAWGALTLDPAPNVPPAGQTPPAWSAQLVVGGRPLGRYWLGPRLAGPAFDADEQARLHALAQQAALALAYTETFDALNALNRELEARIVDRTAQVVDHQRALAVVEERQRLARDLHDSVTQTLFSISLGVRNARGLVRRDPEAAVAALAEQEAAARQALGEMRALLVQLRSAAAEETDLTAALREHCATLARQGALTVTLDLPATLPLPAATANELLLIARETLHNVVKHGRVETATCALAVEGDAVLLTVTDRGQGFDPAAESDSGLGLRGLRERAAALGGTVEITTAPGAGTTVRVRAPVKKEEA